MLIFLDIDGVLRRTSSPPYQLDYDLVANFKKFVTRIEGDEMVEIIITSTWKEVFSLDAIRAKLGFPLALKVCGTTKPLARPGGFERHREICQYLAQEAKTLSWIAIDDQADHFPPGLENLLLCDPTRGFLGGQYA